ncbi:glycosyltransferase [Candidatus Dojkabacteria bacterium]|jgi:hypothetical protein|nr:glycosyltransferase [Candidatus Dojkabacteria bacterium]
MKISVLTLTYQRHKILEEAIQSYLCQDFEGESEMIIINDSPDVEYVYDHPNIRIVNCKERFKSISEKMEFGYKQCKYDYIYRLDDDDLLTPWALSLVNEHISKNIGYDIYKSKKHYVFLNNEYIGTHENVNTGIIYTKKFLNNILFPNKTFGAGYEDYNILYGNNSNINIINDNDNDKYTMIYRSGTINSTNTYHIGGMGKLENKEIFDWTDRLVHKECGIIILNPSFKKYDYLEICKKI